MSENNEFENEERKSTDGFWKFNAVPIAIALLNVLFIVSFYFGVFKTQIEAKPDEKRVREIVREELTTKFSITDGEVLKAQFQNLNAKVDKAIQLIEEHMMKDHR